MSAINFYSSNFPEYYYQKPHYDLGNSIIHSDVYKKLNPIRARYDYKPNEYSQMPFYLGSIPQLNWLYGSLDYSFQKYHKHYQAHDDWVPDRKARTLGTRQGGACSPIMKNSKFMTLIPSMIPRGCYREIRNFQACQSKGGDCQAKKISIMEVCPDHVLEGLREKKKWHARAEVIDNETYRRAMQVSDYNRGRSVSDLKLKTWDFGETLRSDSLYQDDRWDPTKFSHAHRNDNVNFPEQEYKDVFGGTTGAAQAKEYEKYQMDVWTDQSEAIRQHHSTRRMKLSDVAKDVDALNEKK